MLTLLLSHSLHRFIHHSINLACTSSVALLRMNVGSSDSLSRPPLRRRRRRRPTDKIAKKKWSIFEGRSMPSGPCTLYWPFFAPLVGLLDLWKMISNLPFIGGRQEQQLLHWYVVKHPTCFAVQGLTRISSCCRIGHFGTEIRFNGKRVWLRRKIDGWIDIAI